MLALAVNAAELIVQSRLANGHDDAKLVRTDLQSRPSFFTKDTKGDVAKERGK